MNHIFFKLQSDKVTKWHSSDIACHTAGHCHSPNTFRTPLDVTLMTQIVLYTMSKHPNISYPIFVLHVLSANVRSLAELSKLSWLGFFGAMCYPSVAAFLHGFCVLRSYHKKSHPRGKGNRAKRITGITGTAAQSAQSWVHSLCSRMQIVQESDAEEKRPKNVVSISGLISVYANHIISQV
jgi:hypothetical protein